MYTFENTGTSTLPLSIFSCSSILLALTLQLVFLDYRCYSPSLLAPLVSPSTFLVLEPPLLLRSPAVFRHTGRTFGGLRASWLCSIVLAAVM